jgi:hypothetical protein
MVSPLGNFGDWKEFMKELPHPLAWRLSLTAIGAALGLIVLRAGSRLLNPLLGSGEERERRRRARPLAWMSPVPGHLDAEPGLRPLEWPLE